LLCILIKYSCIDKKIALKKTLIILTVALIYLTNVLSVQVNGDQKKSEPIELIYADTLLTVEDEGGVVRELDGNVSMCQGEIKLEANNAKQFISMNYSVLRGNVVVRQKTMTLSAPLVFYHGNMSLAEAIEGIEIIDKNSKLTADSGTYSTEELVANFNGNVTIEDDSVNIYSDKLIYYRDTRESYAYSDVIIAGKYSSSILAGDTVINIPRDMYSIATGAPVLFQVDTVWTETDSSKKIFEKEFKLDTLIVSCDTMESFRMDNMERYVFTRNVVLSRGNVFAKADRMVYDKKSGKLELTNIPVVWYDSTQLHADSIFINLVENRISNIHCYSNSLAATRDDTLNLDWINQIIGDEIKIEFTDGKLSAIKSYRNAKSLFFVPSEDSDDAAARNSSDSLFILFDQGKLNEFIGFESNNGEYFPENMFSKNPKDLYLPRFKWIEERPSKDFLKRFESIEQRRNKNHMK
jgi:lipopolysaccharide export system protein LptA